MRSSKIPSPSVNSGLKSTRDSPPLPPTGDVIIAHLRDYFRRAAEETSTQIDEQLRLTLQSSRQELQNSVQNLEQNLDVKAQEHTATAQDRVEGVVEAVLRSCEDLAQLQHTLATLLDTLDKNLLDMFRAQKSFDRDMVDLRSKQSQGTSETTAGIQKEVANFKKIAAKMHKEGEEMVLIKKQFLAMLQMH